jgi:iron complex transport system substrate-binding protein
LSGKHILSIDIARLALALAMVCTAASLEGCASPRPVAPSTKQDDVRLVTDETGRTVRLPARVERVVTLAPNLTEIVYAVGGGNRLVGDTTYCDYPPEARNVAKVGDTLHPSVERIIALRPQLVLVSTASQLESFSRQLEEQKIAVYITDPRDLPGVFRALRTIAELLGEAERGRRVADDLDKRANQIQDRASTSQPVRVFFQLSAGPLYTAGRDSFVTDLIRRAGGLSVTADVAGAWPRYSDEAALASNPDAIIVSEDKSEGARGSEIASSLHRSPAVLKGRVYRIDGDLVSRPGPRIVDGLEQIARDLHPEAFR